MTGSDSLERLFADAKKSAAEPLWTVMDAMVPPFPKARAVPHVWRYAEIGPLLERAGKLVGTDRAERRVFMLVNPALHAPFTTDTLYAGLQLINPGEVARAHRHTSFALRFIVEGEGAYTAVGGEKVAMRRGDMILTPSWEYHDHGHEGSGPMVWLDGLDLPLWQWLPANFAEAYHEARHPSQAGAPESNLKYPWSEMQRKLDAVAGPWAVVDYLQRAGGMPVSRVIAASAERLNAGASSALRRENASAVYHVYAGMGRSRVGDAILPWSAGDTFAVPSWQPYFHENAGNQTAYLFRFDDRPLLDAIGVYRDQDEENEAPEAVAGAA